MGLTKSLVETIQNQECWRNVVISLEVSAIGPPFLNLQMSKLAVVTILREKTAAYTDTCNTDRKHRDIY